MLREMKLWWEDKKNNRGYESEIKKLIDQGDNKEEVARLEREHSYFRAEIMEKRRLLYQSRLIRQALRLYISIPPYRHDNKEAWEETAVHRGHLVLTEKAMKELRKEVREELKARQEITFRWVAPLSGVTGLVGTLIGLVSVLFK